MKWVHVMMWWCMEWVHFIVTCETRWEESKPLRTLTTLRTRLNQMRQTWAKKWNKTQTDGSECETKNITLCRGMCCNLISFLACITCCTFCNTFCDTFKLQLLAASNQRFFRRATSLLESLRNLIEVHCARATVTTVTTARWRQKRHAAICTQPEVW